MTYVDSADAKSTAVTLQELSGCRNDGAIDRSESTLNTEILYRQKLVHEVVSTLRGAETIT